MILLCRKHKVGMATDVLSPLMLTRYTGSELIPTFVAGVKTQRQAQFF